MNKELFVSATPHETKVGPMLRMSTNAASPDLPDMRMAAGLTTTMTYCSGLPIVPATILERDASSAFFLSSASATVVSSFSNGIQISFGSMSGRKIRIKMPPKGKIFLANGRKQVKHSG